MSKALFTVLAIILVLAIAGGAFYGGMVYGKSQAQASTAARALTFQNGGAGANQPGAVGQPGGFTGTRRANGQGGGFVLGTIKAIHDGGLTLTDNNGKDTEVKVTDTTLIEKNTSVKLTDLAEGETLMVSGSTAADGTVTARSVQVAPQGRFGMMGGPGGQPGAPADRGQGQPGAPAPQSTPAQ